MLAALLAEKNIVSSFGPRWRASWSTGARGLVVSMIVPWRNGEVL